MQCGEVLFLQCPLQLSSSSGALAPPTVRTDGAPPRRVELPGFSSARKEDRGPTQCRHQHQKGSVTQA